MSLSLEELKGQLKGHIKQAQAICDRADAAGNRDFTTAERAEVMEHLDLAKQLRVEIKTAPTSYAAGIAGMKSAWDAQHGAGSFDATIGGGSWQAGDGSGPIYHSSDGRPLVGRGQGIWGKAFAADLQKRAGFGTKDLLTPTGAVGVPGVISTLRTLSDVDRAESFLQLIPSDTAGATDAVSYLKETVRTHNAEAVAAGRPKPTSIYTLVKVDDHMRTVAHLSEPISRQWLSDVGLLQSYIDGALREGLLLELERLAISGDTAIVDEWEGFLNTAGHQNVSFDTDPLRTCRKAITALEVIPISTLGAGFIFHPADWETLELSQDLQDRYQLVNGQVGPPIDRASRRLWGLRVATSLGITQGVGLLVDFQGSTRQWPREQTRVDWSESFHMDPDAYDATGSSGFQRNLVMFRAEARHLIAALRPAGIVEIDMTSGS